MTIKWDHRFMSIATLTASWSKDPRRQVGCVIVDDDKNQLSGGFNGLPRGVEDTQKRLEDRETKLMIIVHAEANAVAAAARNGHSLLGSTAYITRRPCCQCVSLLIQAGVRCVVVPAVTGEAGESKWEDNMDMAEELLKEAGVRYRRL